MSLRFVDGRFRYEDQLGPMTWPDIASALAAGGLTTEDPKGFV